MTGKDLLSILQANNVPEYSYAFGDDMNAGECWVIQFIAPEWHVYFSERGNREREQVFDTEDKACRFMLSRIATSVWYSDHRKIPGLPVDVT